MTVAAIVIAPDAATALADADGEPAIRRIVQAAWAGGALPLTVVCPQTAPLAEALAGLPATLAEPRSGDAHGIGWFARGLEVAADAVTETAAGLLWPCRYPWVDPETVTSLIEAHGASCEAIIRPAYAGQPGFPVLVPIALRERLMALSGQPAAAAIDALAAGGAAVTTVELGDPGIVTDAATPRHELPSYQGPPEPAAAPPPEQSPPEHSPPVAG
jgi:molybdenum cofactor cytidylyltransferase